MPRNASTHVLRNGIVIAAIPTPNQSDSSVPINAPASNCAAAIFVSFGTGPDALPISQGKNGIASRRRTCNNNVRIPKHYLSSIDFGNRAIRCGSQTIPAEELQFDPTQISGSDWHQKQSCAKTHVSLSDRAVPLSDVSVRGVLPSLFPKESLSDAGDQFSATAL